MGCDFIRLRADAAVSPMCEMSCNSTKDGHGAGGCKSSDDQQCDARVKGLSADDVIDEPVHRHRHSRMDISGRAEDANHPNSDPENIEQDIGSILFDHCTP